MTWTCIHCGKQIGGDCDHMLIEYDGVRLWDLLIADTANQRDRPGHVPVVLTPAQRAAVTTYRSKQLAWKMRLKQQRAGAS